MTKSKARTVAEAIFQTEKHYFQWSRCMNDYHIKKVVLFRMLEEAYKTGRYDEKVKS